MKVGITVRGATKEGLEKAIAAGVPAHCTVEYKDYLWPSFILRCTDNYHLSEHELYMAGFAWAIRWRLGVPMEASRITDEGYDPVTWQAESEAYGKAIADAVVLPREQFNELTQRDQWLTCLENAGVDNWDGYSEALQMKAEAEGT